MADKDGSGGKALDILVDLGTFYGIRWLLAFGWKRVTGRTPPTDPEDLHRGIGESLAWAMLVAVATEMTRLLVFRAAARRVRGAAR